MENTKKLNPAKIKEGLLNNALFIAILTAWCVNEV